MTNQRSDSARRPGKNFSSPRQDSERGSFRPKRQDGERDFSRSDSRPYAPKKRPSWELPQFEGQKKFFKKPWGGSKPFARNNNENEGNFGEGNRDNFRQNRGENYRENFRDNPRPSRENDNGFAKKRYHSDENSGEESSFRDQNFSKNRRANGENFSRENYRDKKPYRENSFSKSNRSGDRNYSPKFNQEKNIDKQYLNNESRGESKEEFKKDPQTKRPNIPPFHIAIAVNDLAETRKFYSEILGFREGRSNEKWIDWNCFGHQIVTHLRPTKIDSRSQEIVNQVDDHGVPVPHFGVVLGWRQFEKFSQKLKELEVKFVIEPYIRFQGEVGEQATMFFYDPSGNAFEFKSFQDISQLFEKKVKAEVAEEEKIKPETIETEA